jgi:hypothetical protein
MQVSQGAQIMSLRISGCLVKAVIAHEFMHALGFWHEQSRADRDDYIEVIEDNIPEDKLNNFYKRDLTEMDTLDLPYDYNSVLHYSELAFSKNGKTTIRTKKPSVRIGQRKTLSPTDIEEIRRYYNCY